MAKIFFGTGNAHKLEEVQGILGKQFEIISFRDLENKIEVVEDKPSLEGNAEKKALEFFQQVGIPCFADDTGLEVLALSGRPGVYSARYAGPACDSTDNMGLLLQELNQVENRQAQFRTVVAYYDGSCMHTFEGILHGEIGRKKKGSHGFGYDPIFLPMGYSQTLAELGPEIKNKISHRGIAVQKFADFLS